jgi:uncharacterized lipoprotein YddW (UPF0748 family)
MKENSFNRHILIRWPNVQGLVDGINSMTKAMTKWLDFGFAPFKKLWIKDLLIFPI